MSELQGALMCAGSGSRMTDLTDRQAKALLPVAGVAMFWYPLGSLARAGVRDVKLFCQEAHRNHFDKLLATDLFKFPSVRVEVLSVSREHEDWGTADVLRHYANKFTKDLVVVSCDFVSDASLSPLLDVFRARSARLAVFLSEHACTGPHPGPKIKRNKGRDLVALADDDRVVFVAGEEDMEQAVAAGHWMNSCPRVRLSAGLADCHVYAMRNTVLPLLATHKKFSSVKADLIPFLLEEQFHDGCPCVAYECPRENGAVVAHANTIPAYFEVNKAMPKCASRLSVAFPAPQQFDFKATGILSNESWIEADAAVADRCVIKRSVVGAGCSLGEKARLTGSLVMSGAKIGRGADISQSIICAGAVVEEGAVLVNTIVTAGQKVAANAKIQNEVVEEDDEADDWQAE